MDNNQIFRCPGKVLIAGGYAVLFEGQHSISLGTDKGFYAKAISIPSEVQMFTFECKQFQLIFKYSLCDGILQQVQGSNNNYLMAVVKIFSQFHNNQTHFITKYFCDPEFYSGKQMERKTGLGSSSALIVVCIGVLLEAVGVHDQEILYDLSFKANHLAQNKIGSGFDISTCIIGTQVYSRPSTGRTLPLYNRRFLNQTNLKLIMVDLKQGENTILNVQKVLSFLHNNDHIKNEFLRQSETFVTQIISFLEQINSGISKQETNIHQINKDYRRLMKKLGDACNCEIEPNIATIILDHFTSMDEVIFGICPGAGGYDAIALLVSDQIDIEKYRQSLSQLQQENENCQRETIIFESSLDFLGFHEIQIQNINNLIQNYL